MLADDKGGVCKLSLSWNMFSCYRLLSAVSHQCRASRSVKGGWKYRQRVWNATQSCQPCLITGRYWLTFQRPPSNNLLHRELIVYLGSLKHGQLWISIELGA
jgi:hypothetical protein